MKIIILIAALALCTISKAQDTIPKNIYSDTSAFYLIKLIDKTSLSGKIIERNSNEIIFNDITIGKVTIPFKKIEKITPISGNQYCILTTNDGKKFTGQIISQDEKQLTLKTESLGNISVPNEKIRELKLAEKEQFVNGKYFFPNPHPTRYFFGPSAIPLEKGEGYYQNAYILSNSFQLGVTDHFSLGGGIVIPILFFITPKVSYKVAKNVYLGGGILVASTFSKDFSFGMGVGYVSLTLGNKENNFTINAGWGALKQENYNSQTGYSTNEWGFVERPMFTISGAVRIAPKVSLITENWIFATKEYNYNSSTMNDDYTYKYQSILSFGFRLMGERNSFDIAIAIPSIEGTTIGIPYLDYVFKF